MTGVAVSRMAISLLISTCGGGVLCPHPLAPGIASAAASCRGQRLSVRPYPARTCRTGDHVVDAEIILWVVALHVVVPDIEDIFPRDRYQRRILLHEVLSSPNQPHPLAGIDFDIG